MESKFRAEKRKIKDVRVLTVRQALSWREFRRSCKQKRMRTLYAFPTFLVSSNILTSPMESYFWTKLA